MAITKVTGQEAGNTANSATTMTLTLPNNPTAGNLVAVMVVHSGTTATVTAQDGNGNVYTVTPNSPGSNSGRSWILYLENAPANAAKVITVTLSASANVRGWIAEFAGAATSSSLETDAAHSSATSQTNVNDPAVTTLNNGDLLVGVARMNAGSITSADSPWTGIEIIRSGNWAEYYIQPSAGSQAIAFTQSIAGQWSGMIAAFKAAATPKLFRKSSLDGLSAGGPFFSNPLAG